MTTRWILMILCLLLGSSRAALAQPEDPDIAAIRADFEYGKYSAVLTRARDRIDRGSLSEAQAVELHKFAGLAAYYMNQMKDAERHLASLLKLDPDYALDPFVFPPSAIAYFEKLKDQMSSVLTVIRQEKRLRAERARQQAIEQERYERERADAQRRIDELSRRQTVRTVERRSFVLNFVPFGTGQFQQGRNAVGILLATSQGALAATSIAAYWAFESLIDRDQKIHLTDRQSGIPIEVRYAGIPIGRRREAEMWRNIKFISGGAFYVIAVTGIVDAIIRHDDEVVSTQIIDAPAPAAGPTGSIVPLSDGGAQATFSFSF